MNLVSQNTLIFRLKTHSRKLHRISHLSAKISKYSRVCHSLAGRVVGLSETFLFRLIWLYSSSSGQLGQNGKIIFDAHFLSSLTQRAGQERTGNGHRGRKGEGTAEDKHEWRLGAAARGDGVGGGEPGAAGGLQKDLEKVHQERGRASRVSSVWPGCLLFALQQSWEGHSTCATNRRWPTRTPWVKGQGPCQVCLARRGWQKPESQPLRAFSVLLSVHLSSWRARGPSAEQSRVGRLHPH